MVGVPGRSKACVTCRKRRKGVSNSHIFQSEFELTLCWCQCDLARPFCGQCKRVGVPCGGYDSEHVFVVSTPTRRKSSYSASDAPCSTSSVRNTREDPGPGPAGLAKLQLLARPEEERRCIDLFWEAYFPSGLPIPPAHARSYTCTWTDTAREYYREDESLRYALWANCLLITGKRHDAASWMLNEGPRLYGLALAGVRRLLGRQQGARRDTLIATVKLLSMFEASSY